MKVKETFAELRSFFARPWILYKKRFPLASFVTGRLLTMVFLLFFLGFALFGLMELAPGDIVDQMINSTRCIL